MNKPFRAAQFARLAAQNTPKHQQRRDGYYGSITPKAISRVRSDIDTWKSALRAADNVDNPRRHRLYNLYNDILLDAHLTSQIEPRLQHTLSTPFMLKRGGVVMEEETAMLRSAQWVLELNRMILMTPLYGHTLVELTTDAAGALHVTLLPRNNVIPERGVLLMSEDDTNGIAFRNLREFGTWILEFGELHDFGLLNKAVPHVLFMRFAQACWSELCEIYGIPPRVMKTNTQDPEMLARADAMMRDMGAAAYFIIDETENFEFAKGADTNGDVYRNLISVCKEALSVLVNGAVLGQDTINGNRSKEESGLKLLDKLVQADRRMGEGYWNSLIIPALVRIGILSGEDITYEYDQEEDLEKLWKQSHEAMQYYDIDPAWIKEKFGIAVTGKREQPALQTMSGGFFD